MNKRRVTLYLDPETVSEIKHLSVDKETSVSKIVEALLKKFLTKNVVKRTKEE